MSSQLERELKNAERTAPIKIADLIMVQMVEKDEQFERFLRHFSSGIDFVQIERAIEETRRRATSPKMSEGIARKVSHQQFGDSAAALRELTQNAIDSYALGDSRRTLNFSASESDGHMVLQLRDYGMGMSLSEVVKFLLIPYNTTKENDLHKIGEHGTGWFSVIGISRLVKIRSRRRGSDKTAQVVIREREHKPEALISEHESDMDPGTEVTLYIPQSVKGLNCHNLSSQLSKYAGYVDPTQAQIFLEGIRVNTLPSEYLTGHPADTVILGKKKPLIFSFSKRAMRGDCNDERFAERNKNLQQIVYTQSGLFVKYGSNPFDPSTIHGVLLRDLLKMGLDFWIQIPASAGLTITRNDLLPEPAVEVLEASYFAFKSLFLESIITDDEILYHPSKTLEQGISNVLTSGRYLDHARSKMVKQHGRRKRFLSVILPAIEKAAKGAYAISKFIVTVPFKLARFVGLLLYSITIATIRAVSSINYWSVAKGLVVLLLFGLVVFGAIRFYANYLTPGVPPPVVSETRTSQQDVPHPDRQTPQDSPGTAQQSPATKGMPSPPQQPESKENIQPQTGAASHQSAKRSQERPEVMPQATVRAETGQRTPPSPTLTAPGGNAERAGEANPTQNSEQPTLLDKASRVLSVPRQYVVSTVENGQRFVAGELTFVPEQYRDTTAYALLGWGAILALLFLGYVASRGLRAVGVQPRTAVRYIGKIILFPIFPFFMIGKGVLVFLSNTSTIYGEKVGWRKNIDEKKQRAIEIRRTEIVNKFKSQFESNEFVRDIITKKVLNATICEIGADHRYRSWHVESGRAPGRSVRISIEELINLFVENKIRHVKEQNDLIHAGDYFVDIGQPLILKVIDKLDRMRGEINQRYDPAVIEERLEAMNRVAVAILRCAYLVSGLGLLQIALHLCYPSIPNPYEKKKAYQAAVNFIEQYAMRALKYLAFSPFFAVLAFPYAVFYLARIALYYLPKYVWKKVVWPLLRSLANVPDLLLALVGAYRSYRVARRVRRLKRQQVREERSAVRERQRQETLRLHEEAKRIEAEELRAKLDEKERRRRAREQWWKGRGGLVGLPGSLIGAAFSALGAGLNFIGRAIMKLATGSIDEVVGRVQIDEDRLHRVVEHAGVGQNYWRLLETAKKMDALLSESLDLPKLRTSYVYPYSGTDVVIGCLKDGKRPQLQLSLKDEKMQKLVDNMGVDRSAVYFTLLESLLHHKTHQAIHSAGHENEFYARKEQLRTRFFRYMQKQALTLEDCLNESTLAASTGGQLRRNVPPEEIARLSRFRVFGLLRERERLSKRYP